MACKLFIDGAERHAAEEELYYSLKKQYNWEDATIAWVLENYINVKSDAPWSFDSWFGPWNDSNPKKIKYTGLDGSITSEAITDYLRYLKDLSSQTATISFPDGYKLDPSDALMLTDGIIVKLVEYLTNEDINKAFVDSSGTLYKSALINALSDTVQNMISKHDDLIDEYEKLNPNSAQAKKIASRIITLEEIIKRMQPGSASNYILSIRMMLEAELERIGISFNSMSELDEATMDYEDILESLEDINIDYVDEQDVYFKDAAFNKDMFQFDTRSGAPRAIKLLVRGLPRFRPSKNGPQRAELNELGLPQSSDYGSTFNKLLSNLNGAVNSWDELEVRLRQMHKVRRDEAGNIIEEDGREFLYLHHILSQQTKDEGFNYGELLRTQAVQQFGLYDYPFIMDTITPSKEVLPSNANTNRSTEMTKKMWRERMIEAIFQKYKPAEVIKFLKDFTSNTDPGKYQKALEIFGMDESIPKDLITAQLVTKSGQSLQVQEAIDLIVGTMDRGNVSEIIHGLYSKKSPVASRIELLASAFDQFDDLDHQHTSPDGKMKYNINLHTFLTSYVSKLNKYAGDEDGLRRNFPELFTEFNQTGVNNSSGFVNHLINGGTIEVQVLEGLLSLNGSGEVTKRLTSPALYAMRMANTHRGMYTFIRAADRGVENMIHLSGMNKALISGKPAMRNYLLERLKDEIRFTLAYDPDTDIAFYKEKGGQLSLFGWMTDKGQRNKALDSALEGKTIELKKLQDLTLSSNLGVISDSNANTNSQVISMLDSYLDWVLEEEMEAMQEAGATIPKDLVDKKGNETAVVAEYVYSNMAARIETLTLFGPLQFFKNADDVFKRMAMLNSSKKISRVDNAINEEIFNQFMENSREKQFGVSENVMLDIAEGNIRTINLNEATLNLKEYNEAIYEEIRNGFIESFKADGLTDSQIEQRLKDAMAPYESFDAGDGMGYITIDEYKRAKMREGTWFPAHEAVYQKILSNKPLTANEVAKFTMLKYSYTGKLMNHRNLNAPAIRKFAFLPLLPNIVPATSPMGKLMDTMAREGVGMAFYPSAAKVGHGPVLDRNNIPDYITEEKMDILHYDYMGNQVNISEESKVDTTASTQKNKLVAVDSFEHGELKDPQMKEDFENYYGAYNERIKREAVDMFWELFGLPEVFTENFFQDVTKEDIADINIDHVVNTLLDAAIQRNGHTNVLASIARIAETKVLDISPSRQNIEYMISSIFRNRIQHIKRPGTSAPQASFVGLEEGILVNGDLRFYRKSKATGETLPMDLMVTLPQYIEPLVLARYGKGAKVVTDTMISALNADIKKDEILLDRYHNNEITWEEYLSKRKIDERLRTVIGFRIPNQSQSSSEAARIVKFLSPTLGDTAIVPKALVAKAGSDFDIDKLNLYYPTVNGTRYVEAKPELSLNDMTDKELDNLMMQAELNIMTHPNNYRALMMPVSNAVLKAEAEYIRGLKGTAGKRLADHEILLQKTDVQKFMSFLAGKTGVGQTAVHTVHHPIAQMQGLHINDIGYSLLPHGLPQQQNRSESLDEAYISMGHVTSVDGHRISELLSEFLTAYVDVAKDDYIFDLNMVTAVANIGMMLVRTGASIRDVMLFLNQKSVVTYVQELSYAMSPMADNNGRSPYRIAYENTVEKLGLSERQDKKKEPSNSYFESVASKANRNFDGVLEGVLNVKFLQEQFGWEKLTVKELEAGVRSGGNKKVQTQVLSMFNLFSMASRDFQKQVKRDSADTHRFKTYAELKNMIAGSIATHSYMSVRKLSKSNLSPFGTTSAVRDRFYDIWKQLVFTNETPHVNTLVEAIRTSKDIPFGKKDAVIQKVIGESLKAVLFHPVRISDDKTYTAVTRQEAIELFNGSSKDIVTRTKAMKAKHPDNKFLENVIPLKDVGPKHTNHLIMKNVSRTEIETMIEGLLILRRLEPAYYQDLIKASVVQGTFASGFNNFLDIIPESDVDMLTRPYIDKVLSDPYAYEVMLDPLEFIFEFMIENAGAGTYGLELMAQGTEEEPKGSVYEALNAKYFAGTLKRSWRNFARMDSLKIGYDGKNKQYAVVHKQRRATTYDMFDRRINRDNYTTPVVAARPSFGKYGSMYGLTEVLIEELGVSGMQKLFQDISRRELNEKEEACKLR